MKGKYIIAFCMALVLSLAVVSPQLARADISVNDADVAEALQKVRDSNRSEEEYPYYVVQKYKKNSGEEKIRVSVCAVPLALCTKYTDDYTLHPSDSYDRGDCYMHSGSDVYTYDYRNGNLSIVSGTYTMYVEDNYAVSEFYGIIANHDIYNFETGELFFRSTPPKTELAEMVEQSTRQMNPMLAVIYFLPLGTSLVVSFLALRKCFKMLRTIFSQA